MLTITATLLLLASPLSPQDQHRIPFVVPPALSSRFAQSDQVCTATIISTAPTSSAPIIQGYQMRENLAQARLDHVYRGRLRDDVFWFRWYSIYSETGGRVGNYGGGLILGRYGDAVFLSGGTGQVNNFAGARSAVAPTACTP